MLRLSLNASQESSSLAQAHQQKALPMMLQADLGSGFSKTECSHNALILCPIHAIPALSEGLAPEPDMSGLYF